MEKSAAKKKPYSGDSVFIPDELLFSAKLF